MGFETHIDPDHCRMCALGSIAVDNAAICAEKANAFLNALLPLGVGPDLPVYRSSFPRRELEGQ